MSLLDYYATLGVPSGATPEQIERAYKLQARMSHPDAFPNDPAGQSWANERMKQINEAYTVLRDPSKRADYDRTSTAQRPRAPREQSQATKRPEEEGNIRCPLCEGTGRATCLTCEGRGDATCPGCRGRHRVVCPACRGVGALTAREYQAILDELLRSEGQAQTTGTHRNAHPTAGPDPFWQVGYWDRPVPRTEVKLAPLLSLVLPGAGQLYNREPQKALTYFGIALVLFLGIGLLKGIGLLLWLGFWLYNVYDAHSTAERLKHIE